MDEFLKQYNMNVVNAIMATDVLMAIILSSLLNFILAKVYILTHDGYSYSKSYVHSIVLVGVIISLIMIIIGSNIARAFALVGAMSIVRFRNPVKDSRDLVFIFSAIAIGMACGTKFYLFAIIFLIIFCTLLIAFKYFRFGDLAHKSYVIKIVSNKDRRDILSSIFNNTTKQNTIISVESNNEDNTEILIYEFELKNKLSYSEVLMEIENKVSPKSINLLVGENHVNS